MSNLDKNCERYVEESEIWSPPYMPEMGDDTRSVGPYVPSTADIVNEMLEFARISSTDIVYDLGCGDGRILLNAAIHKGARGLGVEIKDDLVVEARNTALAVGVDHLVNFRNEDLFDLDLTPATVITIYLLPWALELLKERLLQRLQAGVRIVSYWYPIQGWDKFERVGLKSNLYLYEYEKN